MPVDWGVGVMKSGEVAQPGRKWSRAEDYSAYRRSHLRLDLMQMIEGPNLREAKELPTGVRDDVIHLAP